MDPNGAGTIQALDAAKFLKKSRLSDVVLSKIWDLSDPTGKGYLDKVSFSCIVMIIIYLPMVRLKEDFNKVGKLI